MKLAKTTSSLIVALCCARDPEQADKMLPNPAAARSSVTATTARLYETNETTDPFILRAHCKEETCLAAITGMQRGQINQYPGLPDWVRQIAESRVIPVSVEAYQAMSDNEKIATINKYIPFPFQYFPEGSRKLIATDFPDFLPAFDSLSRPQQEAACFFIFGPNGLDPSAAKATRERTLSAIESKAKPDLTSFAMAIQADEQARFRGRIGASQAQRRALKWAAILASVKPGFPGAGAANGIQIGPEMIHVAPTEQFNKPVLTLITQVAAATLAKEDAAQIILAARNQGPLEQINTLLGLTADLVQTNFAATPYIQTAAVYAMNHKDLVQESKESNPVVFATRCDIELSNDRKQLLAISNFVQGKADDAEVSSLRSALTLKRGEAAQIAFPSALNAVDMDTAVVAWANLERLIVRYLYPNY